MTSTNRINPVALHLIHGLCPTITEITKKYHQFQTCTEVEIRLK